MQIEEIISALRNAIEHGESLESAVQIMINSGYNPEEVHEASKFIGGVLSMQEPRPEEQLMLPEQKKNFSSKFKFWGKKQTENQIIQQPKTQYPQQSFQKIQQPSQQSSQQPKQQQFQQMPQQPTPAQIKQSFQQPFQQYPPLFQQPQKFQQPMQQPILRQAPRPGELSREIQKIKPAKQGYMKEIILLIILLILIGVLAATIFFKDKILAWFA